MPRSPTGTSPLSKLAEDASMLGETLTIRTQIIRPISDKICVLGATSAFSICTCCRRYWREWVDDFMPPVNGHAYATWDIHLLQPTEDASFLISFWTPTSHSRTYTPMRTCALIGLWDDSTRRTALCSFSYEAVRLLWYLLSPHPPTPPAAIRPFFTGEGDTCTQYAVNILFEVDPS